MNNILKNNLNINSRNQEYISNEFLKANKKEYNDNIYL